MVSPFSAALHERKNGREEGFVIAGTTPEEGSGASPADALKFYFVFTGYGGRLSFTGGFFFNSSITT